ncbi:MAG: hypothetical protein WC851_00320 [Candidatus Shapirobacteria bacterium]
MVNKELWSTLNQPDSDLANMGVEIKTLMPKRKDGLYGVSLTVPTSDSLIAEPIAEILSTLVKPDQYIFQVIIYDNEFGTHTTTNDAVNPLEAFERAKLDVKRSLVNSAAQDEAMRIEDAESRILDMAQNAAIAEKLFDAFKFEIESVEIICHPASWNFAEKEE